MEQFLSCTQPDWKKICRNNLKYGSGHIDDGSTNARLNVNLIYKKIPLESRSCKKSGRELILATKPFAKEIKWKSWYYTLSTLTILIALVSGIYFLIISSCELPAVLAAGLTMVRMFVIYHDHQHHTILHRSVPARYPFSNCTAFSSWRLPASGSVPTIIITTIIANYSAPASGLIRLWPNKNSCNLPKPSSAATCSSAIRWPSCSAISPCSCMACVCVPLSVPPNVIGIHW